MKKIYMLVLASAAFAGSAQVTLAPIGTYATGIFDDGGTEISAYDAASQHIFSTNGSANAVDVLDVSDPTNPVLVTSVSMAAYGGGVNSIASYNGFIAVAVEANVKQDNGKVVFLDAQGTFITQVTVGALPDMVTFSPNGQWVATANEGEPSDDYTNDPVGSISLIDISGGIPSLSQSDVTTVGFSGVTIPAGVRIYGNGGLQTAEQDLEPEYVVFSPASDVLYVALQENNALAILDVASKSVQQLVALGYKDHGVHALDPSDRRNMPNIATYSNLYGMYQPDAMAIYEVGGLLYLVTANEGDTRDYSAYGEEERIKNLVLDTIVFPNWEELQNDTVLGRLTVTTSMGDTDNDGAFEELYVPGARSFSIWNAATGALVYDSGDEIEQRVLSAQPLYFNSTNDDNDSFMNRSDNKGPEPEAVELANLNGEWYAFVGLERQGGIMVFNISNPNVPVFETFYNNRDFTLDATDSACGDLGPEDILFIPASSSPNGLPLLSVANEVSGTLTLYSINHPGIGIQENAASKNLVVWPNPVGDGMVRFNVQGMYRIYSVHGVLVAEFTGDTFDTSNLESGMYLVKSEKNEVVRLVKY